MTVHDAIPEREIEMIRELAKHLNVNLADGVTEAMTGINQGRSYENTVTFLQGWDKSKTVTIADLDDYKKGASERWRENVFFELVKQNKLVAQVIGTMYTLRFELGLPLYQRFIMMCAEIKTDGLFKKHRLKNTMRLICRHEFHPEGEIVSCPDYQLEIEGRVSPSVQECIDRLYSQRKKLSTEELNSLSKWHFSKAYDFHNLAELKRNEPLYKLQKYQKAVELKPDDKDTYYNWGVALYDLARLKEDESLYEQAIQKYQKAVGLDPKDHEAYNNWGVALCNLAKNKGDESLYEQAIQKYQKAVEIKPDKHEAYNNWGLALYDLAKLKGDESLYKQAIEKYQKALEINPDYHEAYYNWGLALYNLAKLKVDGSLYEQAIEKYQKALEINPQLWQAYFNIAYAYALMKRASEACQALDKAFSINPKTVNMVNTDTAFDPIREDPIFQQWLNSKKA